MKGAGEASASGWGGMAIIPSVPGSSPPVHSTVAVTSSVFLCMGIAAAPAHNTQNRTVLLGYSGYMCRLRHRKASGLGEFQSFLL